MSVLTGPEIIRLAGVGLVPPLRAGESQVVPSIFIEPFDPALAGPNSYDMHLSHEMRVYALSSVRRIHPGLFGPRPEHEWGSVLPDGIDPKNKPDTIPFTIPDDGFWLQPGVLYLGATVEKTVCYGLCPWLDGRSSTGRLGISVHLTAGRGDDSWRGRWTLEIMTPAHPVKVYPGMRCLQVTYFTLQGVRKPYDGQYNDQDGPTASRLEVPK